ncbi:transposable element Tc3 transposase [Trichonephila clavipes]|nr:transposable element Tc3 transposase [Trichonephila clavipes]
MINNFFIPELNNHDVQELWFQQDGATCHTARATIDLLKDTFGDHLISRFGPVNWPPRSCDLTPLDNFLLPSSQYGGYDPRLVTEWVRVRIPSKAWLYLLWGKGVKVSPAWIPVSIGKQRAPSVTCWDHHL